MKKTLLIGTLTVTLLTGCSSNQVEMVIPPPPDYIQPKASVMELVGYVPEVEPDDLNSVYELSDYERRVVECIVMGEAGGESWKGKALVAQCILNACLKDGITPSEVRAKYKYSGWNENPSEDVKTAVSSVFDDGNMITNEPILYFYAPKVVYSKWHESQCHVITEGGHKFFKEWEDWS